jgi:hypothetical protein
MAVLVYEQGSGDSANLQRGLGGGGGGRRRCSSVMVGAVVVLSAMGGASMVLLCDGRCGDGAQSSGTARTVPATAPLTCPVRAHGEEACTAALLS